MASRSVSEIVCARKCHRCFIKRMFDFSNSLLAVLRGDLRVAQFARIDWRHGVLAGKSQVPDVPGSQRRSSAGDA